jgi:hypothetical protein
MTGGDLSADGCRAGVCWGLVRLLVLKQNYLFEYLPAEPRKPIGFAHLQVKAGQRPPVGG